MGATVMRVTIPGYTTLTGRPLTILRAMQSARFFETTEGVEYIASVKGIVKKTFGIDLDVTGATLEEQAESLLGSMAKHKLITLETDYADDKRLYAAYGSNLNVDQMSRRCPTAKPIAKSWLHDYALEFRGQPNRAHATVVPAKGKSVPIVIWRLSTDDVRALDRYEGVASGYYTKKYAKVEVNGEMKTALIYVMTPQRYGFPTDEYLQTIKEGYKHFNFDTNILLESVTQSHKKAH